MTKRETLIENVKKHGMKFPTRHRFVLTKQDGKLTIISTENKRKIKIENEKASQNKTILLDGSPTALLDIKEIKSAEEYADIVIDYMKRWDLMEEEETT